MCPSTPHSLAMQKAMLEILKLKAKRKSIQLKVTNGSYTNIKFKRVKLLFYKICYSIYLCPHMGIVLHIAVHLLVLSSAIFFVLKCKFKKKRPFTPLLRCIWFVTVNDSSFYLKYVKSNVSKLKYRKNLIVWNVSRKDWFPWVMLVSTVSVSS